MPDLPTEAEVAALRESLTGTREAVDARAATELLRRLLALVEAWEPIVEDAALARMADEYDEPPFSEEAQAEWRRWKGETT